MRIKFHFTLLAILLSFAALAQSPQMINYQAVLRNSTGDISQNQSVNVEFVIHSGSTNGPTVYSEAHSATTNEYGLVNPAGREWRQLIRQFFHHQLVREAAFSFR
ncbi:MAG: hypothetical protein IPM82_26785 [Saprospiraceae bacterium]|nr:hypothetical protein [Saprospiraceae bacterium]